MKNSVISTRSSAPLDQQRREIVLQALRALEVRALFCYAPSDVLLLTGYWPVMGTSLAVMSDEGAVVAIVPEDELELAQATTSADLVSYKPGSLHSLTTAAQALEQPVQALSQRLKLGQGRLGVVQGEGMQPSSYLAANRFRESIESLLQQAFPGCVLIPADTCVARLRSVLTLSEINKLRRGCSLSRSAFALAEQAIAPGRREDEIASEINACFARMAQDGFERGNGYFFCMSGPNSAKASGAYARTRQRMLEPGDLVMIHANTVGDGFWTDITRTYVVGEPGEKQQRMRRAIDEARAAALASIRPGVRASEVDQAARSMLESYGFGPKFKHGLGHGVGFAAADANAMPRLHPHSPDVLEAGMTFNVEPAIYFDGWGGLRHCDVVLCTETGAEVLTAF